MPDFKFGPNGIKVNVNKNQFDDSSDDLELLLAPGGGIEATEAGLVLSGSNATIVYKLSAVSLLATSTTVIVPADGVKKFVAQWVDVIPVTVTGTLALGPVIRVGANVNHDDVLPSTILWAPVVDTLFSLAPPSVVKRVAGPIYFDVVTAGTGATVLTADVYVHGFWA